MIALSQQTNATRVSDLARSHFNNLDLEFTLRYPAEAAKLSLEDMRGVAAKHLNNENYTVAIVRGKS